MRKRLEEAVKGFMDEYRAEKRLPALWQPPRLRLGNARHPRLAELRSEAVVSEHFLPEDFLPGATTIVSYYLPFRREVGESNRGGQMASDLWGLAYRATNAMAAELNPVLARLLEREGFRAAVPENIGYSRDTLTSRWSQRHIAWLCGHGTFGVNNMLITDQGCCGRYFSIVADLPVEHDDIAVGENCTYKKKGACLACVKRCVNDALQTSGFDRHRCFAACSDNARQQQGAFICGKCVVGVPCSFRNPCQPTHTDFT